MKKIISILFAVLLLCTLCVPVLAEEIGQISIPPLETYTVNSNLTIGAYCISAGSNSTLCITSNGFLSGSYIYLNSSGTDVKIILQDGGGLYLNFAFAKDAITFSKFLRDSGIPYYLNGNSVQAGVCKHSDGEHMVCKQCGQPISHYAGSVFSEGSLTIIVGIAAAVVFGLGGFFLGTKKKKPALADGANNTDEE